MNYSTSVTLDSFAASLSGLMESEVLSVAQALRSYLAARRVEIALQRTTNASWATTTSERELLNALATLLRELENWSAESPEAIHRVARQACDLQAKKRIVFFVQEYSLWASFRSVYEFFVARDDCDVQLVFVHTSTTVTKDQNGEILAEYAEAGYSVIDMESYDLSHDSPDMVFYLKPYREANGSPVKFYIDEVSKHVRYTVFISYCLDVQGGEKLVRFFYALPMFYKAWRVIAYSSHYEEMLRKYSFRDSENLVRLSHPKFDGIADIMEHREEFILPEWKEIIAGRPVVLWNTHFSSGPGEGVGTFFQHREAVRDFFATHKDYVLLWRPHPYFWGMVDRNKGYGIMSSAEIREEFSALDNVIIDDNGDYRYAFCTADASVSDATTFMVEFGMTGKPVLYTPKWDGESVIEEAYLPGVQICDSTESLISFLESVKPVGDEPRHNRFFEEMFGVCDGNNGQRIGEYLLDQLERDASDHLSALIQPASEGEDRQ